MSEETNTTGAARSGIKTTEFWLALIVAVGGLLAAQYSDREWAQIAGLVAAALSSMGYGVARANVKKMEVAASGVAKGVR